MIEISNMGSVTYVVCLLKDILNCIFCCPDPNSQPCKCMIHYDSCSWMLWFKMTAIHASSSYSASSSSLPPPSSSATGSPPPAKGGQLGVVASGGGLERILWRVDSSTAAADGLLWRSSRTKSARRFKLQDLLPLARVGPAQDRQSPLVRVVRLGALSSPGDGVGGVWGCDDGGVWATEDLETD